MHAKVQEKILSWYKNNQRDLPWRKTTDPYRILISEVMLQQTQVDRVIPYYERWLKKFPTIKHLTRARKPTLLKLWSGLGYNSRALRLQQLAKEVVLKHNGSIPNNEEILLSLPGIGPYTAHAILAFAFNKAVPVLDTNIRRVLIHELKLNNDINTDALKEIALSLVPKNKSCIWHNALMDYGALVLTAKSTGIKPLSKQPTFKGSTREVRGNIMKYLIKHKSEKQATLKKQYPHVKFQTIVEKMQKDGLIVLKKGVLSII